ncbi:MAG: tRNA dihydrouridine synthase DusB [Pseudomonadota bacterium]|nr:tRNA dihydrouridine synthase DusB [Pseudomonadota bacterium]
MFSIGKFRNESRVILAPMAGVTDRPYRDTCRSFGAYWTVSEMMSSDPTLRNSRKSRERMISEDEVGPKWVQIAGSDPAQMASAARYCVEKGADIVDINMGCPAKKVCNKAAGSALLRDESLVRNILTRVVEAVPVPVTLKIRLGWSKDEINATEIGMIAKDCGVVLLTVHGRTRECRFTGKVNYEAIGGIKRNVDLPIVANGDISSPQEARKVIEITNCDAVMIGRAALGKPWLLSQVDNFLKTGDLAQQVSGKNITDFLLNHLNALYLYYGVERGLLIARKHVGWAIADLPMGTQIKKEFNQASSAEEQLKVISCIKREKLVA